MKVTLDAGHGGRDSGAVGSGLKEKDIALPITLKTGKILGKHGVKVHYTRTTDTYVDKYDRANMANDNNSDIFVSIHINSADNPNATGIETLYYPTSIKGIELARSIQNKLKIIATVDRGIKPRPDLVVLNSTKMPAAITEVGFIRNKKDVEIITKRQNEVASLIAQGILECLGIKYIGIEKEKKLDKIKINLHGKQLEVDGIYKDDTNYIPVRFLEQMGYRIDWEKGIVIIDYKEDK